MRQIDEIDRALLNRIQSDFPITRRPFLSIADDLNLSEETVIRRLKRLKQKGVIRRIGGNFAPDKLGFVSTLCAAKVTEDNIDNFAKTVNRYPGVTHNYRRDNRFNIWFTFIARSMTEITGNLKDISRETGVCEIINLPAEKMYKIKAHFDL